MDFQDTYQERLIIDIWIKVFPNQKVPLELGKDMSSNECPSTYNNFYGKPNRRIKRKPDTLLTPVFNSIVYIHWYGPDGRLSEHKHCLSENGLSFSFFHSKTDASCGLHLHVESYLNNDSLHAYSLHATGNIYVNTTGFAGVS